MSTKAKIEVNEQFLSGLTKNEAITKLIAEAGLDFKGAEAAWKKFGSGKRAAKSGGLTDCLDFLAEAPRSEFELYEWVLDNGTKNEARWISQRNAIRLTTIAVYKNCGESFSEVAATAAQKKAIKDKLEA